LSLCCAQKFRRTCSLTGSQLINYNYTAKQVAGDQKSNIHFYFGDLKAKKSMFVLIKHALTPAAMLLASLPAFMDKL
jgi:hypothetical protein